MKKVNDKLTKKEIKELNMFYKFLTDASIERDEVEGKIQFELKNLLLQSIILIGVLGFILFSII